MEIGDMPEARIPRRQRIGVAELPAPPESGTPGRAAAKITPQKSAELRDVCEELAKTKADIESLISAIPAAVYRASPDRATFTTTLMSERWKQWTDNAASDFCTSPETWPESIHPDDRERVLEAFNEACIKKIEYTLEYRTVHRRTGAVRHVRDHGHPLLDRTGRIASIHGVVMDVTDRTQVEWKVRHLLVRQTAVARLASALSESHDPDRTYRIIYDAVRAVIETDVFIVFFFDSRTALISTAYAVGRNGEIPAASIPPIPLGRYWQAARSYVIRTGQPLYIPDYNQAPEGAAREKGCNGDRWMDAGPKARDTRIETPNSAVFVPMRFRGRTAGVIQVQSRQVDAYTREDVALLVALTSVAAVAIRNVQLLKQIRLELTERRQAGQVNGTSIPAEKSGLRPQDRIDAQPAAAGQTVDS
jgi:GAF domain-containing protein/PAS domain-containing protein